MLEKLLAVIVLNQELQKARKFCRHVTK